MSGIQDQRFKALYTQLVQQIFRYIYYKCGDRALAEDLTQDAFVRFWNKIDSVKEGGESSYLYQIAKNLMINHAQKTQVKLKFKKTVQIQADSQSPQFILEEQEFKSRIEDAISNLPNTQREVFLMNRIDGLKYREIAECLNISQKAVEKRMHLALTTLRQIHKNI